MREPQVKEVMVENVKEFKETITEAVWAYKKHELMRD